MVALNPQQFGQQGYYHGSPNAMSPGTQLNASQQRYGDSLAGHVYVTNTASSAHKYGNVYEVTPHGPVAPDHNVREEITGVKDYGDYTTRGATVGRLLHKANEEVPGCSHCETMKTFGMNPDGSRRRQVIE